MENLPNKSESRYKRHFEEVKAYRKSRKIYWTRFLMQLISGVCLLIVLSNMMSKVSAVFFYLAVFFFGLSIWVKTKPNLAIWAAIIGFVIMIVWLGIERDLPILNGFWWKITILILFIRGLLSIE